MTSLRHQEETVQESSVREFRPYPRYQDSGVEPLGEIPQEWEMVRNTGLFRERKERDYQYLRMCSVTQSSGVVLQEQLEHEVVRAPEDKRNYKRICPGDLVYNKMRMWQGSVGVSKFEGIVSPAYVVCVPSEDAYSRYYHHLYRSSTYVVQCGRYSYGICDDMNSLRYKDFKQIYSLLPPLAEQRAIASFLDRETDKIDRLVEKKERLMELLQEKRQALITHAVTRGLDPDAPMKDSDIEWLEEIPEAWQTKKVKHVTNQVTVGIVIRPSRYYVDTGIPCLRSFNVGEGVLNDRDLVFISSESNAMLSKSQVHCGDLVIVRSGKPGTTAVVDHRFDGANCIDLIIVRRSRRYESQFMAYFMNSAALKPQVLRDSGGAIQQHLNVSSAADLVVVMPPLPEQRAIADFLDQETSKIDRLIEKIKASIDLLKEYRSALITAAVTGKIDVREEVAS